MVPIPIRGSLDAWITSNSARVDRAVTRILTKCGLSISGVPGEQARRAELLHCASALNTSWDNLDDGRRSAACRYEWARLQIFLASEVHAQLEPLSTEFFHVTVADKRWCFPPEDANVEIFKRPRRKVRASIETLKSRGFEPVFVAQYELSGDRSLNGNYVFEPHAHILIGGISKSELKSAFKVRLPKAMRGRSKPVRVTRVPHSELGTVLGYLAKTKAEDRVEFMRTDGRPDRNSNRMLSKDNVSWLRCMAAVPITNLIQFGGFAEPITSRFTHCEMATLLGELL